MLRPVPVGLLAEGGTGKLHASSGYRQAHRAIARRVAGRFVAPDCRFCDLPPAATTVPAPLIVCCAPS
ncbi:MAG: hypothetical protein J0H54_03770, partial [Rhizobiales bacterium]|nr:hypothetical protein [Hyphomicrobiales bacterium]